MPKPSKEYARFDAMMGELLSVPKATLDARVRAHKASADENPRKRGPKAKVKPSDDVRAVGEDTGT